MLILFGPKKNKQKEENKIKKIQKKKKTLLLKQKIKNCLHKLGVVKNESDWFYEQDIGPYPDLDKVLVLKCIFSGDGVYYRPCFAVRII